MRDRKRVTYQEVIIRDAVNVRTQRYGSGSGTFFNTESGLDATVMANGERAVRWHVAFLNQGTGEQHRISFFNCMSIGRQSAEKAGEKKLVIRNDRMISKTHCFIYGYAAGLAVADNASRNHTYLNGKKLQEITWLSQGDELTIGNTKLKLRFVRE